MKIKSVIILGAGPEQIDSYKIAKKKFLHIFGVDKNINSEGLNLADTKIINSIYNYKKIIKKISLLKYKYKILGVVAVGVDCPKTIYEISKFLKLDLIKTKTIRKIENKEKLYNALKASGIIPKFEILSNKLKVNKIVDKFDLPLIVKPHIGRGSRDVMIIKRINDLKKFIKDQKKENKKKFIIQKYLKGKQFSVENFFYKKRFLCLISLRNYRNSEKYHPNIIENGGDLNPNISTVLKKKIYEFTKTLSEDLEIENGPLKLDLIYSKGKIFLIEAAARFGGGFVASKCSKSLTGVNFLNAYFDLFLRRKILFPKKDLKKKFISISTRAIIPKKKGIIKNIKNNISSKYKKNLIHISYNKFIGDKIQRPTSHAERAAFIIVQSNKKFSAPKLADKISKKIIFETY